MSSEIRVAIVEDNLKYQDALKTLFEFESSFDCLGTFNSVEKFESSFNNLKDKIDVLLLDIDLPGKTGVEALPIIKNFFPNVKVIMLTQFDNDVSIFNAMSNGANGYLLKSSSLSEVTQAVKDAHSGISPMNPFIASRVLEMFQNYTKPRKDYNLTKQEINVLNEIINGLNRKMIADKLFVSYHTVDSHIRNIYEKLNVNNQVSLVVKTMREQLI